MSQLRVEKVADEVIAADAGRAATTGRKGKPAEVPGRVVEPGGGTPRWALVGGGIALIVTVFTGGSVLGLFGGGRPGPAPSGSVPGTDGGSPSSSLSASIPPPPCDVAASLAEVLGGAPFDGTGLCGGLISDSMGDWVEYNGSPATITPQAGDLTVNGLFKMTLPADLAARLATACEDHAAGLHCAGSPPAAGPYVLYVSVLGSPIGQLAAAGWETGFGYFDASPPGGGQPTAWNGAAADVLTGHNTVYTLRFPAAGQPVFGPFRLFYAGEGVHVFFEEQPSGAFVYTSGSVLLGFIPETEWAGAQDYRFFTFYSLNDGSGSAVDEAPNFDRPAAPAPSSLPSVDRPA